jgi:hypothetical protein
LKETLFTPARIDPVDYDAFHESLIPVIKKLPKKEIGQLMLLNSRII